MTESTKEIEVVLVVPTNVINALQFKQGLNLFKDFGVDIFDTVFDPGHLFFFPRDEMEKDPDFRQLIPYVVFVHKNSVYTYQRMKGQGEKRLHGKWSVGVGGHINRDDKDSSQDYYLHGMLREMVEEIEILSPIKRHVMVGFINDESNAVGKVHLGVLHVIELEHPLVTAIDDSMLDKGFLPIRVWNLSGNPSYVEGWSQIVLQFLKETSADTEVYDWKKLEGRVLPIDGFKIQHPTPEFESLWPEAGIAADATEKPRDTLSVVGQPMSVQELLGVVDRVTSGATTMAEEMAKNLEKTDQELIDEAQLSDLRDLMEGLVARADGSDASRCGGGSKEISFKNPSADPNTVAYFGGLNPDYLPAKLRWDEVEVICGPGHECGIVCDVMGTLSVIVRRVGEAWPIDVFDELKSKNIIQPDCTTYVIQADKKEPITEQEVYDVLMTLKNRFGFDDKFQLDMTNGWTLRDREGMFITGGIHNVAKAIFERLDEDKK